MIRPPSALLWIQMIRCWNRRGRDRPSQRIYQRLFCREPPLFLQNQPPPERPSFGRASLILSMRPSSSRPLRAAIARSHSIIAHLYKSKAPGPAGFAVGHEVYAVNSPMRLEHGSNRIFGGPEAEVSDKYILQVFFFFLTSTEQQMDAQNRADFRTMRESRTANCQSISV